MSFVCLKSVFYLSSYPSFCPSFYLSLCKSFVCLFVCLFFLQMQCVICCQSNAAILHFEISSCKKKLKCTWVLKWRTQIWINWKTIKHMVLIERHLFEGRKKLFPFSTFFVRANCCFQKCSLKPLRNSNIALVFTCCFL